MKSIFWNCDNFATDSANDFTSIIKDHLLNYYLPVVCLFGIFSNLISAFLFSKRAHFKNDIYKYLMVHSMFALVHQCCIFTYFLMKSKFEFFFAFSFGAKVVEVIVDLLIARIVSMLMTLIEFVITIKRLLLIFKLNLTINLKFGQVIAIYCLIASIVCLPMAYKLRIVEIEPDQNCSLIDSTNRTRYDILFSDKGPGLLIFLPILLRGIILPLTLIISNLIIFCDFRKSSIARRLDLISRRGFISTLSDEKRQTIQVLQDMKKNLTKLVISINFMFIIANLVVSVTILMYALNFITSKSKALTVLINIFVFSLTHSLAILFYYKMDFTFRKTLIAYMNKFFFYTQHRHQSRRK